MTTNEVSRALWKIDQEAAAAREDFARKRAVVRALCTHRNSEGQREIATDSVEARHYCAACGTEDPP